MFTISLATVFPSPFVYQPSMHVTGAQFSGYERTLDVYDASMGVANPGVGFFRYRHAVAGTTGAPWGGETVPNPEYDHNLTGYLRNASRDGGEYLVVSEFDRVRTTQVYRGLRFNESDFRAVEAQPGVNHVLSNGDVELYLYVPDDSSISDPQLSRAVRPRLIETSLIGDRSIQLNQPRCGC
jgi:hypothetical protein